MYWGSPISFRRVRVSSLFFASISQAVRVALRALGCAVEMTGPPREVREWTARRWDRWV